MSARKPKVITVSFIHEDGELYADVVCAGADPERGSVYQLVEAPKKAKKAKKKLAKAKKAGRR